MTPDEHRARAEELLADAEKIETPHRRTPETRDRLVAEATLHALLALGEDRDTRLKNLSGRAQITGPDGDVVWSGAVHAARRDRHDVTPNGYIAGEDIIAGAVLGTDPATGHLVMVGRIEPGPFAEPGLMAQSKIGLINEVVHLRAQMAALTSEPALAAFREAWQQADAEGAEGDRVRRGIVAAIEAVS